jgi:hypothetical protein
MMARDLLLRVCLGPQWDSRMGRAARCGAVTVPWPASCLRHEKRESSKFILAVSVSRGEKNQRFVRGVCWDYFDSHGGATADPIISQNKYVVSRLAGVYLWNACCNSWISENQISL